MAAAQHAMAEGDYKLAAQRLIYARDAEPDNAAVLRLMTLAFWQAGDLNAAGRAVRDWTRVEGERPTPHRFAARIYEDMGAIDLAAEAAERSAARAPERRRRLGARRAPAAAADGSRGGRRGARARPPPRARASTACSTSRWPTTSPATSAARSAPASRPPTSSPSPSRRGRATPTRWRGPTAHAEAIGAAERALALGAGEETAELLERLRAAASACCPAPPPPSAAVPGSPQAPGTASSQLKNAGAAQPEPESAGAAPSGWPP